MENNSNKIPIKLAEVSIQKFNESGIPHHLSLLQNHKSNIEKCLALGDFDKIKKEEINATRVIKQLKNLLVEMDGLRSKVRTEDIAKFDAKTLDSRKKALAEINSYLKINLRSPSSKSSTTKSTGMRYSPNDDEYNEQECSGLRQICIPEIQTEFKLSEHQLRSREACLTELENLHREIADLHGIFNRLHDTVEVQGETIEVVSENVEVAQVQVEQGARSLREALSYKKAMYPMCGALIGTCLGGPVGLLAGMKVGGLAAVGCGILGFTGGAAIKNKEELDTSTATEANERKNE